MSDTYAALILFRSVQPPMATVDGVKPNLKLDSKFEPALASFSIGSSASDTGIAPLARESIPISCASV